VKVKEDWQPLSHSYEVCFLVKGHFYRPTLDCEIMAIFGNIEFDEPFLMFGLWWTCERFLFFLDSGGVGRMKMMLG
jgi:hypothetical protein